MLFAALISATGSFVVPMASDIARYGAPVPFRQLVHQCHFNRIGACPRLQDFDAATAAAKQIFVELMTKGGMAVQEGEMGLALGYFKKALELQPEAEQTKKMVLRLETLGIAAQYEDGTVDIAAEGSDAV